MLSRLFREFFSSGKSGSILLLLCTALSLLLANSDVGVSYLAFWNTTSGSHSITHWINDGLMTIFFLMIGLELEREIYIGELSSVKKASLPTIAAIGGMLVPALIFIVLNANTKYADGAGIPMATDIAFAIGILSLSGKRIPASLKIFLTALAVIDDLGAIIIIAVFYSAQIQLSSLLIALSIFAFLLILNRLKVHNLLPYLVAGVFMWYFMLHSGVHATITGVLLAFAIPFGDGTRQSPSWKLQHFLHKPVSYIILPLFALANTAVILNADALSSFINSGSTGIIAGLSIGKPIGILLFSWLAVKAGLSQLPEDLNWKYISGAGMLGGIGFTMSMFITFLAFNDPAIIDQSKIAILIASALSGITGFFWLKQAQKKGVRFSNV